MNQLVHKFEFVTKYIRPWGFNFTERLIGIGVYYGRIIP